MLTRPMDILSAFPVRKSKQQKQEIRPLFGIENGEYTKYSAAFDTSIVRKISRSQLLPI